MSQGASLATPCFSAPMALIDLSFHVPFAYDAAVFHVRRQRSHAQHPVTCGIAPDN